MASKLPCFGFVFLLDIAPLQFFQFLSPPFKIKISLWPKYLNKNQPLEDDKKGELS